MLSVSSLCKLRLRNHYEYFLILQFVIFIKNEAKGKSFNRLRLYRFQTPLQKIQNNHIEIIPPKSEYTINHPIETAAFCTNNYLCFSSGRTLEFYRRKGLDSLEMIYQIWLPLETVQRMQFYQGILYVSAPNSKLGCYLNFDHPKTYEFTAVLFAFARKASEISLNSLHYATQLKKYFPRLAVRSNIIKETETERIHCVFQHKAPGPSSRPPINAAATVIKENMKSAKPWDLLLLQPTGNGTDLSLYLDHEYALLKETKQENGMWKFVNFKVSEVPALIESLSPKQ